jgi:hypothetical protein
LPNPTVSLDRRENADLVASGNVHLARLPAIGRRQILRRVQLALRTPTRRLATDSGAGTQKSTNQGATLLENRVEIAAGLLVNIEELAPDSTGVLRHEGEV